MDHHYLEKINNYWHPHGHLNEAQRDFLIELLNELKPRYCLETGFAGGRSAATILSCKPSLLISVDIDLHYADGRRMADKMLNDFRNFNIVEGDSSVVLTDAFFEYHFPYGVDFAFVDGDHTYKGCLNDLKNIYAHCTKKAVIIIDDYESGPPDGCTIQPVTDAVNDFVSDYPVLLKKWNNNGKGFAILYL